MENALHKYLFIIIITPVFLLMDRFLCQFSTNVLPLAKKIKEI